VIAHHENGFQAHSLICPHLGCTLNLVGDGFLCPCHGSGFDLEGRLRHGPADQPLRELSVEINDQGHLILKTA
jgi:Rieske Fe-S protein